MKATIRKFRKLDRLRERFFGSLKKDMEYQFNTVYPKLIEGGMCPSRAMGKVSKNIAAFEAPRKKQYLKKRKAIMKSFK